MAQNKLDIFSVLTYLDNNNLGVYNSLRDEPEMLTELQKAVTWMLPQWMTGATNESAHIELVAAFNAICNDNWFNLYGHPELQTKLLACCGTGRRVRHKYYKPAKTTNLSQITKLLEHKYEDICEEEVKLWVRKSTTDDMVQFAESCGYQNKEVKEFTKAFDELRKS